MLYYNKLKQKELNNNYKCIDCNNEANKGQLYCWSCDRKFFGRMSSLIEAPTRPVHTKRKGDEDKM